MDRALLDKGCRWGVTGLLLLALGCGALGNGGRSMGAFLLLEALVVAAGLLWCLRLWISAEPRLLMPAMIWPALLFTGYAVARYLAADLEYPARMELNKVLVYMVGFALALNHLHRHRPANLVMLVLIFLALPIAGLGLYQFVTGNTHVWLYAQPALYYGRASATFTCPDHLATFLNLLLPMAVAFLVWGKQRLLTKLLLLYGTTWLVLGVVVSLSRAGWVACAAGLALVGLAALAQTRLRLWACVVITLVLAGGVLVELKTGLAYQRFHRDNPANFTLQVRERLQMWDAALGLWREHPVWGVGPALYTEKYRPYRHPSYQGFPLYAHNDYVEALADWGMAGAALLLAALALFARPVFKHWSQRVLCTHRDWDEHSHSYPLVIGASAGVLAMLLHALVDFSFHVPGNALLALALMAIALSHCEGVQSHWKVPLSKAKLWGVTAALMAGLVFLAGQVWVGGHHWRWLRRAAVEQGEARIEALKRAHEVEPGNYYIAYLIGDYYRRLSFSGTTNYEALAREAIQWCDRSSRVNPYFPLSAVCRGMCLDWLSRPAEALASFQKACALDPNGVEAANGLAWHYVHVRDWPQAKLLLVKALYLKWDDPFARTYLRIVEDRLKDPWFTR